MQLPANVKGLSACEGTLERGQVYACHAGAIVHELEGWDWHEV